ncbi:nuclear distribution protein nudF [Aspergillus cavernicola]|uniref:Mitochondrial division protein 1 n=1 Tax=Aspergillus cavernicola TaxID=176166 RepID=A0ABR4HK25_9EURO
MASLSYEAKSAARHKSMIAYLLANSLPDTAAALRGEANIGEDIFDTTTAKKYEGTLEKKWTSIARLQKKILELESRYAEVQAELDDITPTSRLKRNRDPLERTLKGHTKTIRGIDYGGTGDNVLLASCSSDMSIKLWKPADDYKNIRTLQGHGHIVSAVRFMSSGNLLISASRDTDIRVWDVSTGYCVKTIDGHTGWVRDICLSYDGKFLLSSGHDMTARLWDISVSNPEIKRTMIGHENLMDCCAIAPPTSHQFLAPLAGSGKRSSTSGADFIATGSRDKSIKALAFHPGGKYLLSVSDDKTLRCWDLSQQGKCVKIIEAHDGFVTCLRWAPGIAKNGPGVNSPAAESQENNIEIRCVVATGGWDQRLNIFAG